jgi:hypothetical protein
MRVLKLAIWALTWAAFGYLWRERIAYRERLPAALSPPFALPPPPTVIDLPSRALPSPEAPEAIGATVEIVTTPAPSAPHKQWIRAANAQRMAIHGRTTGLVLAVIVTGAVMGAFVVWMLSAAPSLP